MKRAKPSLWAIVAIALAVPVAAHAAPPTLVATAVSNEASGAELARETETLRLTMAYDPVRAIASRDEAERIALIWALPTGEGRGDVRVQWFMAGAIARPTRDVDMTLLYNPLARAQLLLFWTKKETGWQVAGAKMYTRGPAQWVASPEPWRKAFAEDYRASFSTLAYPGNEWIAFESDRWIGGLANWLGDPARRAATEAARSNITKGKIAADSDAIIARLPKRARASYAPIGAIGRADGGGAVIFGSPLMPQMPIAADFAPDGKTLQRLSLIPLIGQEQKP